MTGNEFLRRINRLGRQRGIAVRFDQRHGKGSHGTLHYGSRKTTLKDLRKEISTGLLHAMLAQLGLSQRDLDEQRPAMEYRYPATLEPDEEGRVLVRFADLPEALTDGADLAEALFEAADCLSEALASRIVDGEEIPRPSSTEAGPNQHIISPSPTIALKAALYTALRHRDTTVADLAARLDMDWHQAARLIDPRRASKLTSLAGALAALDCQILLSVYDPDEIDAPLDAQLHEYRSHSSGPASSSTGEAPRRPPSKRALSRAGKVLGRSSQNADPGTRTRVDSPRKR